jgi:hypothetical protein
MQSLMEICYHDYLFSISILDMYLSSHVVQKSYSGKQVWGRHTTTTKRNLIAKITNYGK